MKLKNNALQELYDTLVSGNLTISPYAESPIDKAFRECDKKIQSEIDILKRSNDTVVSANLDRISNNRKLEKEIEGLKEHVLENHKIIADISSERDTLEKERDGLLSRTHYAEDEVERLRKAHDELFNAGSRKISELRRENEAVNKKLEEEVEELHKRIDILSASEHEALSAKNALEKDLTDAKIQIHYFKHSRDDWKRRVEHAEDEVEALKEELMEISETFEKVNADRSELQNDRDSYHGLYTELRKDYDKLFEENKQIKKELHTAEEARNNLRAELEAKVKRMDEITKDRDFFFKVYHALKNDYKKLEAKYRDMKSYSNCYAEGYSDGKEEGEENLWDMLQNVRDVKPEEFDPECETLGDIIDMDLEDFLDSYKKWEEERKKVAEEAKKKHIEYMRDYLKRYCIGRLCTNCPLHDAYKPVTSCLFSRLTDEEVEKRYRTVIESNNKNIPTPISAWPPQSWECTIEAKVEINKDLLGKVCGIKLDEEEHKLEYGDAVRLPWRDYDYMYIGPDNEEETVVRTFDPKNHAIVTSHIANVRYNGGKIILANEDDLRKIWKDKK